MRAEIITTRDDLVIRRLILESGEAMPWHTDPCRRFTVVVRGERLRIEYRDGRAQDDGASDGTTTEIPVHPGQADWDEPEPRVHRGVNAGTSAYEEVVIFFLDRPGMNPQPEAS